MTDELLDTELVGLLQLITCYRAQPISPETMHWLLLGEDGTPEVT